MKVAGKIAGKRIVFLIVLFLLAWTIPVVINFVDAYKSSLAFQQKILGLNSEQQEQFIAKTPSEVRHLKLKRQTFNNQRDTIVNLKDGNKLALGYSEVEVYVTSKNNQSGLFTRGIFQPLLRVMASVLLIYACFLLLNLMIAMWMGLFFTPKNISRLRRMGFSFVAAYFAFLLSNYLNYTINKQIFEFAGYDIVKESVSGVALLLGIGVLIVAELMSMANKMKEEQKLII